MSSEDLTFEDILKHIDRESEHFVVRLETHHRSGREVTVVEPHRLTKDESSLRELARQLKEALGTGGMWRMDESSYMENSERRQEMNLSN